MNDKATSDKATIDKARSDKEPSTLKTRLSSLRDTLLQSLIERDIPVRLALLAALSGEHLLLLGPPGTAKSEIARRLRHAFRDAAFFERLLTRFSVPEELFGPLSIKALEEDRYQRQTAGYLPEATVAFIDEIFKANSAILNSLLTLLNEREFDNGSERRKTPLVCAIGASNELPEGEELEALYDRFLLRFHVEPVSEAGFDALLNLRGDEMPRPALELRIGARELEELRRETQLVKVPDTVQSLLKALRKHLNEKKIYVSDRRWRKVLRLLQTSAYTDGRNEVSIWDCWLLQHCLWAVPEQREDLYKWYCEQVGAVEAAHPQRLARLIQTLEARLEAEANAQGQAVDEEGNLLWEGAEGKPVTQKGKRQQKNSKSEPVYLAPSDSNDRTNRGKGYTISEVREKFFRQYHKGYNNWGDSYGHRWTHPKTNETVEIEAYAADANNYLMEDCPPLPGPARYSQHHIQGRLADVKELKAQVDNMVAAVSKEREMLVNIVGQHLWVSADFAVIATARLDQSLKTLQGLAGKIIHLHDSFKALPLQKGQA